MEKEYKEKIHTDYKYRSSLLYVAPLGIFVDYEDDNVICVIASKK